MRKIQIKGKIIGQGLPKVCIPLVGRTEEQILRQADMICRAAAQGNADMAELRGDFFEGLTDRPRLLRLLEELKCKFKEVIFLFTVRSEAEGGEKLAKDAPKVNEINRLVIESGIPDMVDIELCSDANEVSALTKLAHDKGIRIVMSNHDFSKTPEADVIVGRLRRMQDMGADIAKIAVMPENVAQVLTLLEATNVMYTKYAEIPLVTISMGSLGGVTRLCGQIFGSAVTFASLEQSSAPGQIPAAELYPMLQGVDKYCVRTDA